MRNNDEKSIMAEAYLQRLKYNSKSLRVILYSTPRGFEYDEETKKIRPLNSVLWYETYGHDRGESFSDFLSKYCKFKLDKLDDNGYATELSVGVFENSCLSIDLNKFEHVMINKGKRVYLVDPYQNFIHFINGIYKLNDTILKQTIRAHMSLDLL